MTTIIPAKTFLLGEYLALSGGPALVLTTSPCFALRVCAQPGLHGIHPESPAGRWWAQQPSLSTGLTWHDPYHGRGGMGASSAQFLGVYLARMGQTDLNEEDLLQAYLQVSYHGQGLKPSGYDVLAQANQGCVYLHQHHCHATYTWPWDDLSFILVHTGHKLATHHHLESLTALHSFDVLSPLVEEAHQAIKTGKKEPLLHAINAYHHHLKQVNLVAAHTLEIIERLQQEPDLLAIKGCGAMGADVLALMVPAHRQKDWIKIIQSHQLTPIATEKTLFSKTANESS